MATTTTYKGLTVLDGAAGAGGQALTNNFKSLADEVDTAATAKGNDTEFQYNDGGTTQAGAPGLTYNKGSNFVTLPGASYLIISGSSAANTDLQFIRTDDSNAIFKFQHAIAGGINRLLLYDPSGGSPNAEWYFEDGGHTGFGVSNPTERIDVSGNILTTGNIRTSAGEISVAAGQKILVDGSGGNDYIVYQNSKFEFFLAGALAAVIEAE